MTPTIIQLLKFGAAGITSNLLAFMVYLSITLAGVEYKASMTIVYFMALFLSYLMNSRWAFESGGSGRGVFVRYLLVYAFGYVLNLSLLIIFVDFIGFSHQIIQALSVGILAVLLFFLQKYWVFSKQKSPSKASWELQ